MASGDPNSLRSVNTMGSKVKIGYKIAKHIPIIKEIKKDLDNNLTNFFFVKGFSTLSTILIETLSGCTTSLFFLNDIHHL
jgi:hypothetical protein